MNEPLAPKFRQINVLDDTLYAYDSNHLSLTLFDQSKHILKDMALQLINRSPAFVHFLESIKPTQLFDVRMTQTAQELFDKGELVLKFSESKNGFIPVLSDKSGKFVEQVVLDPKTVTPQLTGALTNLSMQQQLGELMAQMDALNNTTLRIERGQRDDRIGLFYSARQQYIEAASMSNQDMQTMTLLNASRTANNARFQLMQTMRSDVEQIIANKRLKKTERDNLSSNVRDSMRYINKATGICVMSFSALGETKPLLAALKSYQNFIEQSLLIVSDDGLTQADRLHQNYSGSDNEWLKLPKGISEKIQNVIDVNIANLALSEAEV